MVVGLFLTSISFAGVTVMFVPFVADFFGYDATEAAMFLAYIGVLGILDQGVLILRTFKACGITVSDFAEGIDTYLADVTLPTEVVTEVGNTEK